MNDLTGFVNSDADERILKSLPTGDECPEELEKAMNKAGLTQKEIQVQGKNGTYTKKVWVRAGEKPSKTKDGSNLTEEEMDSRLSAYKKNEPDITKLSDEHLSKLLNDTNERITKLENKANKTDDDKTWLHGCKKRKAKYENEMKHRETGKMEKFKSGDKVTAELSKGAVEAKITNVNVDRYGVTVYTVKDESGDSYRVLGKQLKSKAPAKKEESKDSEISKENFEKVFFEVSDWNESAEGTDKEFKVGGKSIYQPSGAAGAPPKGCTFMKFKDSATINDVYSGKNGTWVKDSVVAKEWNKFKANQK